MSVLPNERWVADTNMGVFVVDAACASQAAHWVESWIKFKLGREPRVRRLLLTDAPPEDAIAI